MVVERNRWVCGRDVAVGWRWHPCPHCFQTFRIFVRFYSGAGPEQSTAEINRSHNSADNNDSEESGGDSYQNDIDSTQWSSGLHRRTGSDVRACRCSRQCCTKSRFTFSSGVFFGLGE